MAEQETTQRLADIMSEPTSELTSEPTSELTIDLSLDSLMEESTVEPQGAVTVEMEPIVNPTQIYDWRWEKVAISIAYETMGEGSPVLLLPALSTISSRDEMRELGKLLSINHKVYLLDWVGFGESDRPKIQYEPKVFRGLLRSFVRETFSEPIVVMAAGHTAGYVMDLVAEEPKPWSWVVLLSPTWRGPLPSMMGEGKRNSYRLVQGLINLPIVGQFLYWLNTTRGSLKFMMKRHVYANAANITKDVLKIKQKITKVKGARFASAAFVTGALDPVRSSEDWLKHFQPLRLPVLMVIGEQMPPKSRKEDEIVANFSGVQVVRIPGSLSLHEEYPEVVFAEISPFLEKYLSKKKS
jgi:pimeloyl-ACP methyl ester carboxylesterase